MSTQHSRGWEHNDICVYVNRALKGLRKCNNAVKRWIFSTEYFHFLPKGLKEPCCTNQLLSVLWAPIEIPCYSGPNLSRFLGAISGQNNMGCQWEPIKLTVIG